MTERCTELETVTEPRLYQQECRRDAVGTYHGVFSTHPVCLAHAQRHANLGIGYVDLYEPLNGQRVLVFGEPGGP